MGVIFFSLLLFALHITSSIAFLTSFLVMIFYYLPPFRKYREYMFFMNFHLEYHTKLMRFVLSSFALATLSGMTYLIYLKKNVSGLHLYGMVFTAKMFFLLFFLYLAFPYFKSTENSPDEENENEGDNKKIRAYLLLLVAILLLVAGFLLGTDSLYN